VLFSFFIISFCSTNAQVGIGTTTPKSSLDIEVSDASNPSNTDGLLIPRIDVFPIGNPTADQQGMLVYLTTAVGANVPGFYYWNNPTTTWINIDSTVKAYLEDIDGDTKIQVEESADEDIIRFDVAGTEYFRMNSGRLETTNAGGSVIIGENTGMNDDYSANDNVFIGHNTGTNTAGGSVNIAIGKNAFKGNVSGSSNIALGFNALDAANTGSNNLALGNQSLSKNTSGNFNIALGYKALAENTTSSNSIALGNSALGIATGANNIGIGYLNLYSNTSGNNNTSIGYQSGRYNTGSNNVFLGYQSGYNETGSDKLYIENSNSTSPLIYGDFSANLLRVNGTLDVNNAYQFPTTDGASGQALTTDGSGNITWVTPATSTALQDTDADTKIQVEESADEDIIRFDMAGTEYFRMNTGRLETVNTGGSVIIGENAGLSDDLTGRNSVYVGTNAGKDNVRGYENVALGLNAFTADTDGFNNVAIGTNALLSSIGGSNNVAIGKDALSSTIGGHDNVAIGTDALKGNTGDTNVGIGQWAGRNNTGYRNIFIGHGAGDSSGNVSNRLFIDMAPSSFPLIYGEFDNELLRINGTLDIKGAYQFPTADGTSGQALTTNGSGNVTWATPSDTGAFEVVSGVVKANSTVDITSDDFVFGSTQLDHSTTTNLNNRFFFDKSKGAFRVGTSTTDYWDENNLGVNSFAAGADSKASGSHAMAWGKYTTASNTRSTAWGYGTNSTAQSSTSWGHQTKATADIATAWGQASEATGSHATAWGIYTDATGVNATSWGDNTLSASYSETVLGAYNTTYIPISSTTWNTSDRLFVIGNGTSTANRSNALTLKKNGDLGLGTDNPTAKLDIRPGDNAKGIYINHDKTTNGGAYGAHIDLDHTAGTSNTIYGALIDATKTGATSNSVYGVYGRAYDIQTGTGTRYIYGLRGYSSVSSSNGTTNSRGVYGSTGGNGDNEFGGYFVGNVYSTGAYQTSDRKLKNNIQTYSGALEKLSQLDIKSYTFKTKEYQHLNLPEGQQIGVIAQDLEKVFPGMVKRADESAQLVSREEAIEAGWAFREVGDKDMVEVGKDVEILAVNYTNLVPVLIQATKEQQTTIENQATKIENLEARLQNIEQLLLNKK